MMARCNELRGLIYSKYSSLSDFARVLGWSRQRLNMIVNGNKTPDLIEAKIIASALNTNINTIAEFFLPQKSTNA